MINPNGVSADDVAHVVPSILSADHITTLRCKIGHVVDEIQGLEYMYCTFNPIQNIPTGLPVEVLAFHQPNFNRYSGYIHSLYTYAKKWGGPRYCGDSLGYFFAHKIHSI